MKIVPFFQVQKQVRSEWCWAAMTTSVEHFFARGSKRTQCDTAGEFLGVDCCDDSLAVEHDKKCNRPNTLHNPLRRLGWLAGEPVRQPLSFEEIQQEIDEGRPVPILVKWCDRDGALRRGHFIAIRGYDITSAGDKVVFIHDPLFPDSQMLYDVLASNAESGGYRDGAGVWFASFRLRSTRAFGGIA